MEHLNVNSVVTRFTDSYLGIFTKLSPNFGLLIRNLQSFIVGGNGSYSPNFRYECEQSKRTLWVMFEILDLTVKFLSLGKMEKNINNARFSEEFFCDIDSLLTLFPNLKKINKEIETMQLIHYCNLDSVMGQNQEGSDFELERGRRLAKMDAYARIICKSFKPLIKQKIDYSDYYDDGPQFRYLHKGIIKMCKTKEKYSDEFTIFLLGLGTEYLLRFIQHGFRVFKGMSKLYGDADMRRHWETFLFDSCIFPLECIYVGDGYESDSYLDELY